MRKVIRLPAEPVSLLVFAAQKGLAVIPYFLRTLKLFPERTDLLLSVPDQRLTLRQRIVDLTQLCTAACHLLAGPVKLPLLERLHLQDLLDLRVPAGQFALPCRFLLPQTGKLLFQC